MEATETSPTFDLHQLHLTYQGLISEQYKTTLKALMNQSPDFQPPMLDVADATINEAAVHIQRCSVYHAEMSRLASLAKNAANLSEGLYKQRFRTALGKAPGSNAAEREAWAATETEEAYETFLFYQSASQLFDSLEKAARVAADSSRKIADLIHSQHISEAGNKI